MSDIPCEETEAIAHLARIELSPAEVDTLSRQLGEILGYVERLAEVDVEGVEPFINAGTGENVFREDVVTSGLANDEALANAPEKRDGFFQVPRVT